MGGKDMPQLSEMDHKFSTVVSIEVDKEAGTVTIVMPLMPENTVSGSGKMTMIAATNNWQRTSEIDPRSGKPMTISLALGTSNSK
jgi:ABC-type proline/glycine betaine transport system ATPase subunit